MDALTGYTAVADGQPLAGLPCSGNTLKIHINSKTLYSIISIGWDLKGVKGIRHRLIV